MDSGKKGNNNGLKIATVVASILALCGVGFGVYGMMQGIQKETQINDYKSQIKELEELSAQKDTQIAELTDQANTSESSEPENMSDIVYQKFAENLMTTYDNMIITGEYSHWTGSDNERRSVMAKVEKGHLTIYDDAVTNRAVIAEAEDVISMYYIKVGNGDMPYIYIIKKDGSVARIYIGEGNSYKREFENLDGYKNIVAVFSSGYLYGHLLDIEGNIYETY